MANLSNINDKFLVTTGGNVLIGQTAAVGSSILQVTGAANIKGTANFAPVLTLGTAGAINAVINSADEMFFNIDSDNNQTSASFHFGHNSTTGNGSTKLMTIKDTGVVAIGPDALDIQFSPASTNSGRNLIYLRGNAVGDKPEISLNHYGHHNYHIGVGLVGDGLFSIGTAQTDAGIVMNTSGKVGIGTTEPKGVLSVDSGVAKTSTTFTRIASFKTSEAYASFPLELSIAQRGHATSGSQSMELQAGHYGLDFNANLVLQRDGGNVGIGTTSPTTKLQINAGTNRNLRVGSGIQGTTGIDIQSVNDAVTANAPLTLSGSLIALMEGDVGIGTITPGEKLVVAGNVFISGGGYLTWDGKGSYVTTVPGNAAGFIFSSSRNPNDGSGAFPFNNYGEMVFQGNPRSGYNGGFTWVTGQAAYAATVTPTPKMTLTTAGNLGIGETSPSTKLQVFDSNVLSARWYKGSSNFSNPFIVIVSNMTSGGTYPQITIKISLHGHGVSSNAAQWTESLCTYDISNGAFYQTNISHTTLGPSSPGSGLFSVSGTSIGFTPNRQSNYDQYTIQASITWRTTNFDY